MSVSLILAGVGLLGAARGSDTISVERQARSALHAMEASVDELALQQETVAVWDDAARHLVAKTRDAGWIHDNIGGWLHRIFKHDEAFILDGSDQPIYASVRGEEVSLKRYEILSPDIGLIANSVRGQSPRHSGIHDRDPAGRPGPGQTVRTTIRATHDSHIMLIGGRPAAASAMLVHPSTENYVRPRGEWPILISIRYLDRDFLAELSSRQLIASPRFSTSLRRRDNEHAVSLRTEWGSAIGYLIWQPELPGTRIMWKLIPLNVLILFGLFLFTAFLGRRLGKAANELSDSEARSAYLAYHDSLTGLPNRALFQRKLEEHNSEAGREAGFALALLDVDKFKLTNDTLGHDAGDAVLTVFAARLKNAVRSGDLVARLGGDEFALLLAGMRGREELETYSHNLLEHLGQPFEHRGKMIHCRASIGATTSNASDDAEDILKHADLALYEAKAAGGGLFRMFDPSMWSDLLIRQEMLSAAQAALDGDLIRPYYQAKIDLKSGAIVGFEALLRCCLPGRPAKGPECIAAAFEDVDLAVKLSDRMIDGVIEDISAWRVAGLRFGHVAINAGLADMHRGDFAERLLGKLARSRIPPECIQVEITESVLLGKDIDHIEQIFMDLTRHGIRLALDDFGTGFASLTHLKRFPIEIIKIDRSFVHDLQIDAEDGAIVDALIGLGKALKIEVVAEGIETAAQRDFLCALGCATGQGFLFGHALPAATISELLQCSTTGTDRAAA